MNFLSRLALMRGEYWVYLLAGIISATTVTMLYLNDKPIGVLRWW
jgi:hypothetical protein